MAPNSYKARTLGIPIGLMQQILSDLTFSFREIAHVLHFEIEDLRAFTTMANMYKKSEELSVREFSHLLLFSYLSGLLDYRLKGSARAHSLKPGTLSKVVPSTKPVTMSRNLASLVRQNDSFTLFGIPFFDNFLRDLHSFRKNMEILLKVVVGLGCVREDYVVIKGFFEAAPYFSRNPDFKLNRLGIIEILDFLRIKMHGVGTPAELRLAMKGNEKIRGKFSEDCGFALPLIRDDNPLHDELLEILR